MPPEQVGEPILQTLCAVQHLPSDNGVQTAKYPLTRLRERDRFLGERQHVDLLSFGDALKVLLMNPPEAHRPRFSTQKRLTGTFQFVRKYKAP